MADYQDVISESFLIKDWSSDTGAHLAAIKRFRQYREDSYWDKQSLSLWPPEGEPLGFVVNAVKWPEPTPVLPEEEED